MAFNISKFKTSFERFGGPARANLFQVEMSAPQWYLREPDKGLFTPREFTMFCSKANFPGVAVNTSTVDHVGQLPRTIASSVTNPGPLTFTFMCDSDHHTLRFFHRWIRHVGNYAKVASPYEEWEGRLPGEVGFPKGNYGYVSDLEIKHYSTDSRTNSFYSAQLIDAFPISVGELQLSWDSNDSFLTVDVQFAFNDYHFNDDKAGNTGDRSSRGAGLLDVLGDIAGFADTVRGTLKAGKPRSIQDAVNRLQRLGNAVDNLGGN